MREQSSGLVTAADKNSAIGILFDVDHDVIVRMLSFQQGNALELLKNFGTLSWFHFKATPWSDNFSSTNQKTGRGNRQKVGQTSFVY